MIVTLMMIIMTVEMNYLEDTMIFDDRQQYQMIMMKKNYFADTTISKHSLTAKKNYFIDAMTLEHLFFWDIPSSLPLSLRRSDIEKEYDDTFLRPPQSPTVEALKTDFDCPITNLIDQANNVIEIIPKNEKKDFGKYDLHYQNRFQSSFHR